MLQSFQNANKIDFRCSLKNLKKKQKELFFWEDLKYSFFWGKISSNCSSQLVQNASHDECFRYSTKKTALNWQSNQFGTKNPLTSNVLNFISFIYLFISILHLASIFSILFFAILNDK